MPSRYLLAALSSLFLGYALAQEVLAPLPGSAWIPLSAPSPSDGCGWALEVDLANHLTYASGSWGEAGFDLEELRITPSVGYRKDSWALQVFAPLSIYYGGVLDYILDPLHQALGLPHNEVQGQVLLYAGRGGVERRWEGATWGLRDPYLRLDYLLGEGGLYAALAPPVGSVERFMGSGGWRALVGGAWRWPGGEASLGALVPLGPQPGLEPFPFGPGLSASVRMEGVLGSPLGMEIQGFLGPLRGAGPFSGGLALRFHYGPASFSEDGSRGMPDVVFHYRVQGSCGP